MTADRADKLMALRRAFGGMAPPDKITEEAFEGNDAHLRRLVRLKPGEEPKPDDLREYIHDLRYTKIQDPLLAYLLPFCLDLWREDLRGVEGYGGIVEDFYPVLADRQIFDTHLTRKQGTAVSEFIPQTMLAEVSDQRGLRYKGTRARSYRWIGAVTTYGVLLPDIELLWTAWWSVSTVGRAISAMQYISCLMYPENENPVFAPWTPNGGGAPAPFLSFEGQLVSPPFPRPTSASFSDGLTCPACCECSIRPTHALLDPR